MENVVAVSADLSRRILSAESDGQISRASDLKNSWAEWRDSLSPEDKEKCVWAFVAAQSGMSETAMKLLREQKPEIYAIYQEVQGG